MFTELKILRDVYGEEEATLQLSNRLKSLAESVNHFGPDHNYTKRALCRALVAFV